MTAEEVTKAVEAAIQGKSLLPFYSYMLIAIFAFLGTYFASYLKKKAENHAVNEDFKDTLNRIEKQVNSVKGIEEQITHFYLEEREISRIKREKLERIYEMIGKEVEMISKNQSNALADMRRDIIWPLNTTQMLISLYFKNEMEKELEFYLLHRGAVITHIKQTCKDNYERNNQQYSMSENMNLFKKEGHILFKNLNQAKVNIELALEKQMKNLLKKSDEKS